jgi:glycosyltransferase involved in cell wall biosynthesis
VFSQVSIAKDVIVSTSDTPPHLTDQHRVRVVDVFNTDRAAKSLGARRAELLNDSGRFENVIICGPGPYVDVLRSRGIQVLTALIPRSLAPLAIAQSAKQLGDLLQEVGCTILHTHGSTASLCARLAARRVGTPIVVHTVHGFHFHARMAPIQRRFFVYAERLLARYTHALLFQNREDMREAGELGITALQGNVYMGNGIDLRSFTSMLDRMPDNPPAILMIGRFEPVKNQAMLLRAARILLERGVQFGIYFAGTGPTLEQHKRLAAELELADRVEFLGYLNDVPALIGRASIAALTSIKEGIPRGLLEPMAAGLPVIATDVKGNRETVPAPEWLVPLNDDLALADRLQQLLSDEPMRRHMGQTAAAWVRRHFDEELIVQRLIELYDCLLVGNPLLGEALPD